MKGKFTVLLCVALCFMVSCFQVCSAGGLFSDVSDLLDSTTNLIDAINDLDDDPADDDADQPIAFSGQMVEVELAGKKVEIHQDFKDAMDEYEAFFDEYVDCMTDDDPDILRMTMIMSQYAETLEAMEKLGDAELSDAEMAYYFEVYNHINQKLILAGQ